MDADRFDALADDGRLCLGRRFDALRPRLAAFLARLLALLALLLARGARGLALTGGGKRGRRRNACQQGSDEKFTHGYGLSQFDTIPAPRMMKDR